jgi:hypothetical protein
MRRYLKAAALIFGVLSLLVALALYLLSSDPPVPLALQLQSYTNATAVYTVKNLGNSEIHYFLTVERKITNEWPRYGDFPHIMNPQTGVLLPKQVSTVTVPVMVYAPPYPWRVSIFCYKPPSFRMKSRVWLIRHGMGRLVRPLRADDAKLIQVSSPEMEQREK